jgi:hypothetical protein
MPNYFFFVNKLRSIAPAIASYPASFG